MSRAIASQEPQTPCFEVQDGHARKHPWTTLEGPTRKPRHASVFSTHSDTQAVPAFHCIRLCLKACFRQAKRFKTHRHAVYQCLKKPPIFFRHASVFKKNARFDTLACPFLKRAFYLFASSYLEHVAQSATRSSAAWHPWCVHHGLRTPRWSPCMKRAFSPI